MAIKLCGINSLRDAKVNAQYAWFFEVSAENFWSILGPP